ncbi:uncharacterized protein [Procambarus clarkii]|uniref:uncharacterized protein isoform X2 n=1 Tax=Procambarus clarkii TaxID=6728 RepID=UPI0037444119
MMSETEGSPSKAGREDLPQEWNRRTFLRSGTNRYPSAAGQKELRQEFNRRTSEGSGEDGSPSAAGQKELRQEFNRRTSLKNGEDGSPSVAGQKDLRQEFNRRTSLKNGEDGSPSVAGQKDLRQEFNRRTSLKNGEDGSPSVAGQKELRQEFNRRTSQGSGEDGSPSASGQKDLPQEQGLDAMKDILPASSSEDGSCFDSSSSDTDDTDVDVDTVNDDPKVAVPSAALACTSHSGTDGTKDTATEPKEAVPATTHTSPKKDPVLHLRPSACSSHACCCASEKHYFSPTRPGQGTLGACCGRSTKLPHQTHNLCKKKGDPQTGEKSFKVDLQTNGRLGNFGLQAGTRPCNFSPQKETINCTVEPWARKRPCSCGSQTLDRKCNCKICYENSGQRPLVPSVPSSHDSCIETCTSSDMRKQCLTGTTYQDFGCQFPEILKEEDKSTKELAPGLQEFVCSECGQTFDHEHHYKKHMSHFSNQSLRDGYKCMYCSHLFKTKCARKHHHMIHKKPPSICSKDNICYECGLQFSKQCKLRAHLRMFTVDSEKRIFKCYFCRHSFTSEVARNRHEGIHGKDRKLPCCCCDSLFPTRYALKLHRRKQNITYPPQCLDCGRVFAEQAYLEEHLKQVKKDLPYECYVCHHKLQSKLALSRHINLHTSDRKYECPSCLGRFVSVKLFQQHQILFRNKANLKIEIIK